MEFGCSLFNAKIMTKETEYRYKMIFNVVIEFVIFAFVQIPLGKS